MDEQFCIFGDESSQNGHRYLVLGTTICSDIDCEAIETQLAEAARSQITLDEAEPLPELKWEKVKARNVLMYRVTMETYFHLAREGRLNYYGLVVDTSQLDHKAHSAGDSEVGFNKLFFSLLFKYARVYKRITPSFYVYLDDRTTRHSLDPIREMLNKKASTQCGLDYDPYKVLQFRKSHTELLIQLTDVITGAIAYQMNEHHQQPNAAAHKVGFAEQLAAMANVSTLTKPTPYVGPRGFDLWHYDLSKAKRVPRA